MIAVTHGYPHTVITSKGLVRWLGAEKGLLRKPRNLSLIPRTHVTSRKGDQLKVVLRPAHTHDNNTFEFLVIILKTTTSPKVTQEWPANRFYN